jgi:anti-anti-sigma factor
MSSAVAQLGADFFGNDTASSTLRIDLSEVTFLDSTGLGALIRIGNCAKPRPVILENPRPNVMRVLDLTAMHHVFKLSSQKRALAPPEPRVHNREPTIGPRPAPFERGAVNQMPK